jgi:hypothetical protein
MTTEDIDRRAARPRRLWLLETLIVAGILVFGGFALFADSPANSLSSLDPASLGLVHH